MAGSEHVVFILGAGASYSAGVPLMRGFLETSNMILHDAGLCDATRDAFETVSRGVKALKQDASYLDTGNLEDVFQAFEMASSLLHYLGDLDETDDVQWLPEALATVIAETIKRSMRFPVREGVVEAPIGYAKLASYLLAHADTSNVITFNYDCGLDYAFACAGEYPSYVVDVDGPLPTEALALMKLHGSLHFERPEVPDAPSEYDHPIVVHNISQRRHAAAKQPEAVEPGYTCLSLAVKDPYIIAPTSSKLSLQTRLWRAWNHASRCLRRADSVVICGYSFPATDAFFRYLFSAAMATRSSLPTVYVLDPCPNKAMRDRFLKLLPGGSASALRFAGMTFDQMACCLASGGMQALDTMAAACDKRCSDCQV